MEKSKSTDGKQFATDGKQFAKVGKKLERKSKSSFSSLNNDNYETNYH